MSAYPYPHQQPPQPANPALFPFQRPVAVNPALLAQHQGVSPAQLLNPQSVLGMGSPPMQLNPAMPNGAINPAMLAASTPAPHNAHPAAMMPAFQRPSIPVQDFQAAQAKARQMQYGAYSPPDSLCTSLTRPLCSPAAVPGLPRGTTTTSALPSAISFHLSNQHASSPAARRSSTYVFVHGPSPAADDRQLFAAQYRRWSSKFQSKPVDALC